MGGGNKIALPMIQCVIFNLFFQKKGDVYFMKFSRITAFLTLLAMFFIFPLQPYAASGTQMPMATPQNQSQYA